MAQRSRAWLNQIINSPAVESLVERVDTARGGGGEKNQGPLRKSITVQGSRGSSTNLLAGALAQRLGRLVLLVTAHLDEADEALDDLAWFSQDDSTFKAQRFGALEVLPGESSVSLELLAQRLAVVGDLSAGRAPDVLVAPIAALMQSVPKPETIAQFSFSLQVGAELSPGQLLAWLDAAGYQRVDAVDQPGDFAMRGGIVDIYPPAGSAHDDGAAEGDALIASGPIRVDFFGDQVDSMALIDLDTMGSARSLQRAQIIGASIEQIQSPQQSTMLTALLPADAVVVLHEPLELTEQARGYFERLTNPLGVAPPNTLFEKLGAMVNVMVNQYGAGAADQLVWPIEPAPAFSQDAAPAVCELGALAKDPANTVMVLCEKQAQHDRLLELIREHAPDAESHVQMQIGYLHRGFIWKERAIDASPQKTAPDPLLAQLILIPHHELFHRYQLRRRIRRIDAAGRQTTEAFFDVEPGDYVVHVDHGVARFAGVKMMRRGGLSEEYLTLEFAEGATLHVPASQIELVQRYVGGFEGKPPLSALGGKRWGKQKQQAAEAAKNLAAELLRVQAARAAMPGVRYPEDTVWQSEFEAEFPYDETEDQLAAIAQVKRDMTQGRPMDRLICGDVGFGKTEVAVRAAFKAVEFGKQAAVLVPTTVLAEQHERTFRERLADYPFRVESISRFKTAKQQQEVLDDLAKGAVDIIIGTHRLLSNDVKFADLGLVVIDEEQRFGVDHKTKLLQFRLTADVLTLSATPIPRTLHMAMLGLRDISSLTTAPMDRRAVVTEVIPYNEKRIQQAIVRELNRDGQVFFLHNRVHDIESVADDLQRLAPKARILIGHGQMSSRHLEQVMLRFVARQADILVCTTIIESGIDIPTANTILINQADHFGLADLHQLRGRVGRYKHRAYCYLLLPSDRPVTDKSAKRLKAVEQYSMLGAGFKIAMRDLEIRGAGNLLGSEQSGHIAAVGYELYCRLLELETRKLNNETIITPARTHLELPIAGVLPKRYIASDKRRLSAYRRISRATSFDQLDAIQRDVVDAFGAAPAPVQRLFDLTQLRIAASLLNIDSIKLDGPDLIFKTRQPHELALRLADAPGRVTQLDEQTLYYRPPAHYVESAQTLLAVLRKRFVDAPTV